MPGHRQEGGDTEDRRVLAWWLAAWPCLLALGHSRRGLRQSVRHTACPDASCGWRARMARGAGVRCPHPVEPGAPRGRMAQRRTTRGQPSCRQSRAPGDPYVGGGAQCSLVVATPGCERGTSGIAIQRPMSLPPALHRSARLPARAVMLRPPDHFRDHERLLFWPRRDSRRSIGLHGGERMGPHVMGVVVEGSGIGRRPPPCWRAAMRGASGSATSPAACWTSGSAASTSQPSWAAAAGNGSAGRPFCSEP